MIDSEPKSNHNEEREVVSVSKHGQATIPKRFRDQMGIDAPGKVAFRKRASGEVVIEHVPSAAEMRDMLTAEEKREDDRSATQTLRELRDRDKRELDQLTGVTDE